MPPQRRRRDGCRHARHDLVRDALPLEGKRFLAAPAEHERIATLQADDAQTAP